MDERGRMRIQKIIDKLKALKIREENLIQELEEINSNSQDRRQARTRNRQAPTYHVGDRIYVTNQVRWPLFASGRADWTAERERQGTVTAVERERVYFDTDNGTATWRLKKNVRPLRR